MDDVLFVALAESAINYADEKYGRAAAWVTGFVIVVLPIALIIGAIWWFSYVKSAANHPLAVVLAEQ